MTSKEERQRREAFWREQVEHWKQSGATQTGFCKANNLVYHRFVYWLHKFEARPRPSAPPAKQTGRFVGVTRTEPESAAGLTVALPNGMSLQGITPDNVATACWLMERLS